MPSQSSPSTPSAAAATPHIAFSDDLPISAKREKIAQLISDNQVLILAGETGSGKTTQLPKICLQLGRGEKGMIGHTQPRRIAARTVASRIAEELKVELGATVGYQVRFKDHSNEHTRIKLMTDGILLAEIKHDPLLRKYDTLIIDEAHERSLNIDFMLGYLKEILPRRRDLKVIVTSATIDLEKFSQHFDGAPIVEVSGRTWPVELQYQPWQDEFDDVNEAIVNAAEALFSGAGPKGDVLVFLSGEREIREASNALRKSTLQNVEVLPLYARLSLADQNRIFQNHKSRRIVLATNVAETSLTVPGIRYVIDPGTARIKRYSLRTKVQRLPIEAISQASANQRMGRCGRVSEGLCVRLYDEKDFQSRPEFTEAEILRSNLAGVVLQMLSLNIGDIWSFPFVDAPEKKLINDGYRLLEELGAVTKQNKITPVGKKLCSFQLDPKMARILLAAKELGCLSEALIIVSGLSIPDVRDRPADKKQQADEKHRRFRHDQSDFMSILNLWHYLEGQRQSLSQNQLRKLCHREFLNYLRFREWRDLHHQLRLAVKGMHWKELSTEASYEAIHRALLAGLLSNVGQRTEEENGRLFKGTRSRSFFIFPGSALSKKRPPWIMAAEMIETSQLFAHCVAKIEPAWVVDIAKHLVKVQHFEPHYSPRMGQVMAYAKISLYGLVLIEKRKVSYGKIDAKSSRSIFIRSALVEGAYRGKGGFFRHNKHLIESVLELEARSRKRDIMVDDEQLFAFFNELVAENIVNLVGFEAWRKKAEQEHPQLLYLQKSQLMLHQAAAVSEAQFPKNQEINGISYELDYHFEPGHVADGVSIKVPVALLHQIPAERLDWLVPGMLKEKCMALLKGLPKNQRKKIVPIPHFVDGIFHTLTPCNRRLTEVLGRELSRVAGIEPAEVKWDESTLDDYYRFNVQVVGDGGKLINQQRDLQLLRQEYREQIKETLANDNEIFQSQHITTWNFDCLEEQIQLDRGSVKVTAFPALLDKGDEVELLVCDNPLEASNVSVSGKVRLAFLGMPQAIKYLQKELLKGKDFGLSLMNIGSRKEVLDDLLMAAVKQSCKLESVKNRQEFENALERGRGLLVDKAGVLEALLLECIVAVVEIKKKMKASKNALALAMTFADINTQLSELLYKGFLQATPETWLAQYPRFLQAVLARLEKAAMDLAKDKAYTRQLEEHMNKYREKLVVEGESACFANVEWQKYRWMIEELRVSFFAQQLKTSVPVSDKRLKKQWAQVLDGGVG